MAHMTHIHMSKQASISCAFNTTVVATKQSISIVVYIGPCTCNYDCVNMSNNNNSNWGSRASSPIIASMACSVMIIIITCVYVSYVVDTHNEFTMSAFRKTCNYTIRPSFPLAHNP